MIVKLNETYDVNRKTLLLYFQVAMGNKLFGHTLREVYLPFIARMANKMGLNLVYLSANVDNVKYYEKHNPPCDGFAVIDDSEYVGQPETFINRFNKLDVAKVQALNPVRLVSLTTPLVIHAVIKRSNFTALMNMKQSTMNSINNAWILFLGGMFFSERLNIPLDHIIVDPLEADYRDVKGFNSNGNRYFLYESSIFGTKSLQISESYYANMFNDKSKPLIEYDEDKLDLLVGYSITQKPRLWLQTYDFDSILANSNLKYRVCLKDKFRDIDTFVWDKKEYLRLLSNSKFTVIIPSYEERAFSTIRFTEAIFNGCVPLILDRCNLSEAFSIEEQDMLKCLVINDKNIVDVIKSINYDTKIIELQEYFLKHRQLAETI